MYMRPFRADHDDPTIHRLQTALQKYPEIKVPATTDAIVQALINDRRLVFLTNEVKQSAFTKHKLANCQIIARLDAEAQQLGMSFAFAKNSTVAEQLRIPLLMMQSSLSHMLSRSGGNCETESGAESDYVQPLRLPQFYRKFFEVLAICLIFCSAVLMLEIVVSIYVRGRRCPSYQNGEIWRKAKDLVTILTKPYQFKMEVS